MNKLIEYVKNNYRNTYKDCNDLYMKVETKLIQLIFGEEFNDCFEVKEYDESYYNFIKGTEYYICLIRDSDPYTFYKQVLSKDFELSWGFNLKIFKKDQIMWCGSFETRDSFINEMGRILEGNPLCH